MDTKNIDESDNKPKDTRSESEFLANLLIAFISAAAAGIAQAVAERIMGS